MSTLVQGRKGNRIPLLFSALAFLLCELSANELARGQHQTTASTASAYGPLKQSYVGSRACSPCHRNIYERFLRTAMGRSIAPVTGALLMRLHLPASIFIKDVNQHLDVFSRDGKLYQSQYEMDAEGKEIFRDTHQIDWIIGSGANGYGGLVRNGDYLFQAPLSFYSKPHTWDLSPGYEFGNYGFNRPILAGCIVCHSGRPAPASVGNGRFKDPPFLELAIGCENCHGPGWAHVTAMRAGKLDQGRRSIVNPATLPPELANNICMFCHQTGDVRVLKPGRDYQDFKPGEPLDSTLSIFLLPPKPGAPPESEHLEHYYSMTLSKCYRSTQGRLECITCHDPHVEPSPTKAPGYFAKKCLTCHTEQSCALPLETRRGHQPPDACSDCHMPKKAIGVILHSSVTSHRILAREDEPPPESAYHQTTPALPDLIHLSAIRGETAPPRLVLLQAYGELMDKFPEYRDRYFSVLNELAQTRPENALVQAALGRRDLRRGNFASAVAHLQPAMKLDPSLPLTYADLAEALAQLGQKQETVPLLEKAIELDPFNAALQKTLVLRLIELRRYSAAQTTLENYVQTFPQDSFMRRMLMRAKASAK
ncbi:MAG: hypothetical protein DMG40_23660 [Acidobacteria bacterium]|nr:MAG: hypothetical protein DMG40_23660 [Acidobacteriota bacterium]